MPETRRWGQQYALYLPRTLLGWQASSDPDTVYEADGTFLLVDISGFTAMSEMLAEKGKVGSEEVTDVLNAAFTELLDIVMLDGGDLLRFGGDALFNLYEGPGHAARACRSALDMRDALEEFQRTRSPAPLQMSVGIASGPISAILAGTQFREMLFVGPTASEVVALQTAADPGDILVSASTKAALEDGSVAVEEKSGGYLLRSEPESPDFDEDDADADVSEVDLTEFIPVRLRDHLSLSFNEGEHRPATIAFLKFHGTDAVYEAEGAVAVGERLDELVTITQTAADRYGVCFLAADVDDDGGKLILTTGVPERNAGHGERIVNALADIVAADPPFPVGAGVARGHVFAGDLGARFRRVYTVMGDTVNLAARLAAQAGPGEVLATARALDRAADAFETVEMEPIALKGKSKPIAPLRVGPRRGTQDAARLSPDRELVGRTVEVETVYAVASAPADGHGQALEVIGQPGMGKSLIVAEALQRLPPRVRVVSITCERYESATPYHAAGQLLRTVLELKDTDSLSSDLGAAVEATAPAQMPWLPLLADVVQATAASTPEVDALAEDFRTQMTNEAFCAVLAAGLDGPTALVVEDAQWADESSRQALAAVVSRAEEQTWAVLTLRSVDEGEPIAPDIATLEIGPLSEAEAVELVTAVAGEATPLPVAEEIARRADGNPFFIVELALAAGAAEGDLPETVEAVTLARIDKLRQADRRLLRYASVFGETFAIDLLADALPEMAPNVDDPEVWHRLDEFLDTGAIGKVRFRQALIRDVAYGGLPFRRRAEVHLAIAEALERRARRRPERYAEAMSLHFDRAEDWERSWTYSVMAGDRAAHKMAYVEAIRIYNRGLRAAEHLSVDATSILRIKEAMGDAAEHLGLFDDASESYRQCLDGSVDQVAEGRLARKLAMVDVARGEFESARGSLDQSLAVLASAPDREAALQAELETMTAIAGLHFRLADYEATVDWCTKVIEAAGDRHKPELAHAFYMRSAAYSHLPGIDGSADGALALAVYEELGDLVGQTNVLNNMGYDAYYRGAWDEAVELYERSVETGTSSGDIVRTASSIHNLGEIFLDQGHYDRVEEPLRRSLRIWQGASFVVGSSLARANLGRLYTRTGNLDAAVGELDAAKKGFTEAGAEAYILEEAIRRSEWLVYAGDAAAAHELATATASAAAATAGTEVPRAALHRLAAYALASMGRSAEACEEIDLSLALARESATDYEIAQTLEAALRIEGADPERFDEEQDLETRLGIVARPWIPINTAKPHDESTAAE